MSIGQEVSVTALQVLAAFGAVANGGVLMQPRLVQATLDDRGQELQRYEPRAVRQVISPQTARTLTTLLVRVVEAGTGHAAAIVGYPVAGKTGTAQKLDPATRRYSHAPGVLSFVGFVPADAPRLVMLVMLDEPKNEKWGSEAAAPIFSAIGGEVLRYLAVAPTDAPPVQIVTGSTDTPTAPTARAESSEGDGIAERVMPDLRGRTLRQALASLATLGMQVDVHGRGRVIAQTPPPLAPLEGGLRARLELQPAATPVLLARAVPRPRPGGAPEGNARAAVLERAGETGDR